MKILLLGKNGQLGWEVQRTLAPLGDVFALASNELDITQFDKLRITIREIQPQIILNAAAYTDVDRAESEPERVMAINARAPGVMAEEARAINAVLIHYSTDYVFDGLKNAPYIETDETNALNVYGQSKLAGEQAISQAGARHVILRTSWVYSLRGSGFVSKVLSWARERETLRVVSDQIGSPTSARMLAETMATLLERGAGYLHERAGVYHLASIGNVSRLEWARAILDFDPDKKEQITRELLPALSVEFSTPALRPPFSALDCSKFEKTFNVLLPEWKSALKLAMTRG